MTLQYKFDIIYFPVKIGTSLLFVVVFFLQTFRLAVSPFLRILIVVTLFKYHHY